jgi:hypothetical protein
MRAILSVFLCIFAAGCISTNVQRLDEAERPARSSDSVEVLYERPQQPYTVIAVLESEGRSAFDSFEDLQRDMVAEAAKLGGDALILGKKTTDSDFVLTGITMIKSDTKHMAGAVIVYDRRG